MLPNYLQELNENQISKISEEDKKIKDIYKKYEEYDKLYYGYKIKNISLNLHQDDVINIPTEYEKKFVAKGFPIYMVEVEK